jgi:type II secretory pathway pseudopilin PulG
MNQVPRSVQAFTLIEMLIAVGLGSLIVYVAIAGFRTASQTITQSNRLSLENSLLRAGYFEAQTQLDFWTNLDDPTLPDSQRPLKADPGRTVNWPYEWKNHGLPFTPMTALRSGEVWPKAGEVPRGSANSGLNSITPRVGFPSVNANQTDAWENDQGWDPTYSWAPHDPRTWSRANMAEKERHHDNLNGQWYLRDRYQKLPPIWFGRYAIFANTNPGAALQSFTIAPDPNDAASSSEVITYSGYPSAGVHTWYYRQVQALAFAMGYAAFCEYLPPNAIYTWYSTGTGDRTYGDIEKLGITPWYNFCNGDGDQRNSRGIYRQTYSTSYGYFNPRSPDNYKKFPGSNSPPGPEELRQWHYQRYETDYGAYNTNWGWDQDDRSGSGAKERWSGVRDLRWFIDHINYPEKMLVQRPTHWPDVEVSVGRLIKNAHHVAVAKVRRTSPLTGEVIELSWCGLGTTLRGARQQRHQTSGWARWDNGGGSVDPNLDTP